MPRYPLLIAFALLSACAQTVDLGQDESEHWSDSPTLGADPTLPHTVYQGGSRVVAFTVDDSNLYALLEAFMAEDHQLTLVSCPVDRCQSQRTTLFSAASDGNISRSNTALLLAKGKLYWQSGYGNPASGIVRCSTSGCPEGAEQIIETAGPNVTALASDGDFVYWMDSESVLRRAADGTGNSESLYRWADAAPISGLGGIVEFGDYLYLSDDSAIFRIRKDGSGAPEVIARGFNIGGVAVSSTGVYFTANVLAGKVLHCPLTGCTSAPDEVVENQRWPSAIRIANDAAYFIIGPPVPDLGEKKQDALLTSQVTEGSSARIVAADLELSVDTVSRPSNSDFALNQRSVLWRESTRSTLFSIKRLPR